MTESTYKSIGDIAKLIGVKSHTLRFWEEKIPYLKPKKINGVRYYNVWDIACIKQIQIHLKHKGYTIKGVNSVIKKIGIDTFRNMDISHIESPRPMFSDTVSQKSLDLIKLDEILKKLRTLRQDL